MSGLVTRQASWLATQFEVCKNPQGRPVYTNEEGHKCIIGCILPKYVLDHIRNMGLGAHELYLREMVFTTAIHIRLPDNTYEERINFLKRCQEYHDEDYGYAHDLRQLVGADYRQKVITIRRRIKKFIDGDIGAGSL